MSRIVSNKKKIRGWRNQVRKIDKWKDSNIELDTNIVNTYERYYLKICIDPWNRFIKRNPPLWYNRLILKSMIDIYASWFKTLSKLKEPFNLKIWLFEPNFILSQIVYDCGESYGFYDNTFEKSNEKKSFPFEKYGIENSIFELFEWELCVDYHMVFKQLDMLTDEEVSKLVKSGYEKVIMNNENVNDELYRKQTNCVWVGKLKS